MRNWLFDPFRAVRIMNVLILLTGLAVAGSIAFIVTSFMLAQRANDDIPSPGLVQFMLRLETGLEYLAIVIGLAALLALAALVFTYLKYRRKRGKRGFNDLR